MELVLSDEELAEVYAWVDSIPLSRPKKAINRDFADAGARFGRSTLPLMSLLLIVLFGEPPLPTSSLAVLLAEIVHHYHPRAVELHNYA
jgi:hypothetical protein